MSRFSLRPDVLREGGQIRPGVKLLLLMVVTGLVVMVVMVIALKGQSQETSSPTQAHGPIEVDHHNALDAVMAQRPVHTAIPAEPAPLEPSTPVAISSELVAMQRRLEEAESLRRRLLAEAIYSDMSIRYDTKATEPVIRREAPMEKPYEPNVPSMASIAAPDYQGALDTTLASQASKEAFLSRTHETGYLPARREVPLSEFELAVGTLIPATLISAINSDTPNHIIAQVSQNVYDSARGSDILIPQGTRLFGTYDSRVAYGQRRLPVTWSRINFPDGTRLDIGSMASMDVTGMGGLTGKVNNHYWRLFGQSTLLGGISGLTQAGVSDSEDSARSEAIADGVTQQYAQTGSELIRKNMNIQPTIEIDNAEQFYIMINQDIVLPPYSPLH